MMMADCKFRDPRTARPRETTLMVGDSIVQSLGLALKKIHSEKTSVTICTTPKLNIDSLVYEAEMYIKSIDGPAEMFYRLIIISALNLRRLYISVRWRVFRRLQLPSDQSQKFVYSLLFS